ncbi:TIGR02466 family protein [Zavarzinella formosa]|uniref:TIGR02466 family protein n=1 Tax=Zavarzinella formosa TaxID=360055 RepID=UPI00030B0EFB|nr:TIGR02466 family protein [Zavarzinella formosa]
MSAPSPFDLSAEMCWPTIIFHRRWQDHDREAPGIVDYLCQLREEQKAPLTAAIRSKSNTGIYESHFDLFTKEHSGLKKLLGFISQTLSAAISHVEGGRIQPSQLDMVITESWFHITNDGGFHDAHLHPNCSWCGIYYVQIGDSGPPQEGGAPNGGSRFYSPMTLGYRDPGNYYFADELDAPLQDGMLVLFPSYLRHSGLPYKGERDRIVIAFNARIFHKGVPNSLRP